MHYWNTVHSFETDVKRGRWAEIVERIPWWTGETQSKAHPSLIYLWTKSLIVEFIQVDYLNGHPFSETQSKIPFIIETPYIHFVSNLKLGRWTGIKDPMVNLWNTIEKLIHHWNICEPQSKNSSIHGKRLSSV
jgi:hypothetical protein